MKSSSPATRSCWLMARIPRAMLGVAAALLFATAQAGSQSASNTASSQAKLQGNGIRITGDAWGLDATASAALMRGYSGQPLSVRILAGWVDQANVALAKQASDPAEKKKKAMGSFGTVTVQIAAGKAEPGSYQLSPDAENATDATVVIEQAKEAGLAGDYTSQSGTLTIQSVTRDGSKVTALAGRFDGQFASSAGNSRAFSGDFRYAPKKK